MIRKPGEMKTEIRENMRGGAGPITFLHFFGKEEFGANVRLCARLTIPAGAGIGPHPHVAEDEIYIIERGAGVLDDGTTQTRVSAGDAILTGRGQSHAVRNDGREDLVFIAVIMGYPPPAPGA